MSNPRTNCAECGEELWGHTDRHGLCAKCRASDSNEDDTCRDDDCDLCNYDPPAD